MQKIASSGTGFFRSRSSHGALGLVLAMAAAGGAGGPAIAASTDAPAAAIPAAADALANADAAAGGEIVVSGRREAEVIEAGPLGTRSILETPFSVAQADSEQITRIAATTIDAAFNYDPSVRSNNSGLASGNTFSVRGQSVDLTNGYKYDGLAFPYWFQDQPIEALDQIQVLKGAGGFVYGYASPSGVVNFVSKKPTDDLVATANLSYRSNSIWRAHVDIGGPFTQGGSTKFRFNAVSEEGRLYNGAENRNKFVQLWLQGDISDTLSWSVDGYYQRTWQAQQSNTVSFLGAVTSLKPVSGNFNLGSPSTNKLNDIAQLTGRLNYQISEDWKLSGALRYSTLDERFTGNTAQINNNAGDYQVGLLGQNRAFYYYVGQLSFEGKFRTGALEHMLVGGFDYLNVDFDYDFTPYTANGRPTTSLAFGLDGATSLGGNIYTGLAADWANATGTVRNLYSGKNEVISARLFQRPPDWFRYQEIRQRGLFLSDTIRLGRAELMVGGRYTFYKESNYEPVVADTYFDESSFTPVAALSYDVTDGVRAYVSYVQALQRGGVAPFESINPGTSYGPIKSTQYEAGIKVQRSGWGATLAVFKTNVPSEFVTAAVAPASFGTFVRDGEREFKGVEFDANWQATREVLLKFGISSLDAVQTKASSAYLVGTKVPGTTAFQTSGFVEYAPSVIPGLSVFGGVRHSGKSYGVPQANGTIFTFNAVTVGDLGISYELPAARNHVKISANVQNITDTWYWLPSSTGAALSAGAPRTFSLSLSVSTGPIEGYGARGGIGGGSEMGVRDRGFYLGLAAGGVQAAASDFDIRARINPALGVVQDGVRAAYKPGWEIAGSLGYDFGLFRTELEASHQQFELKRVAVNGTRVPIDALNRAAGSYDDPSGTTRILALMGNGLFDIGGNARTRWAFEAGGGIGLGRIHQHRWQLQENVPIVFANENKLGFAWQALAGARYRLTGNLDATLRYRYFNLPGTFLQTSTANALEGSFRTHSLLVGLNVRL